LGLSRSRPVQCLRRRCAAIGAFLRSGSSITARSSAGRVELEGPTRIGENLKGNGNRWPECLIIRPEFDDSDVSPLEGEGREGGSGRLLELPTAMTCQRR
jgi:hypothetical protein